MKRFSDSRSRPHTTFVVTLTWAFGLAFGMSSACLLEKTGKHAHIAASYASDAHHAHASDGLAGNAHVMAFDHDSDADASKESCLMACDCGSKAQIKLQAGVDCIDPGQAPLVVFEWKAPTPVTVAPSRFDDLHVRVV